MKGKIRLASLEDAMEALHNDFEVEFWMVLRPSSDDSDSPARHGRSLITTDDSRYTLGETVPREGTQQYRMFQLLLEKLGCSGPTITRKDIVTCCVAELGMEPKKAITQISNLRQVGALILVEDD